MDRLESILKEKIISDSSAGGGCIADARIVETSSGAKYFVKSYSSVGSAILRNEANGLRELEKSNAIRVPHVVHQDNEMLVLEYIRSGSRKKNFSEIFGMQFAEMHKFTSDEFGFFENNFIGSTPQINLPRSINWIDFYWNNRLLYQYRLAEQNGYVSDSFSNSFMQLEKRVPLILEGSEEKPCVLHGDLWGGNYMTDENGNPVLIDPAVYYGHREADLGMTYLFGGFDSGFYKAYNEHYPLPSGWEERIDIYKLYHVMNHLNLFGTGYYSHALSIVKSYL
ncbi:MAG: fructosamine kinase family protein [Melioribacteraceae bacterium]|nr:fructosamine kinase family protein [Melioribacteraceae bacterium]